MSNTELDERIPMASSRRISISHVTAGDYGLANQPRARRRSKSVEGKRHHGHDLITKRVAVETAATVEVVVNPTLTMTYYETVTQYTISVTPVYSTSRTSRLPITQTSALPSHTSYTLTSAPSSSLAAGGSPMTSTTPIILAKPPPFPTALVATLCTLIPLSALIGLGFYFYFRRRRLAAESPSSSSATKSRDKYVWGPLGLVRRRERDNENPVLKAQEMDPNYDPVAEAIRQEERERLGRMKRSGEARFYAPGVRHLVEHVGSKERVKVMIDWRDRLKMDRRW